MIVMVGIIVVNILVRGSQIPRHSVDDFRDDRVIVELQGKPPCGAIGER
jgi:hypothetical protein